MKTKTKFSLINTILYFIASVSTIFIFGSYVDNEKLLSGTNGLKLISIIEDNATAKKPSYSVWGPIDFTLKGETAQIEMNGKLIKQTWVQGEVSLIEAKKFEDGKQKLLSPEEIKKIVSATPKGNKKQILEVYSFDFTFWQERGVTGGEAWSESDTSLSKYFDIGEKGRYYLLVKFYSPPKKPMGFQSRFKNIPSNSNLPLGSTIVRKANTSNYSPKNLRFIVKESSYHSWWIFFVIIVFIVLFIVYFIKLMVSVFAKD